HFQCSLRRGVAEIVPDACLVRDDVGLQTTIGDHIVRTLVGMHVFAAVVPADIHEFHGVERTATGPGAHSAMGGYTREAVLGRNDGHGVRQTPGGAEAIAHVVGE